MHIVSNVSASVGGVMQPAGYENAQGLLSAAYAKDGADPQWDNDPGMKKFFEFLARYYPEANKLDASVVYGYGVAQTLVQVLKMCGDELTRENVMKQAASLKNFELGLLLPGIRINTSPTDYFPIEQMQMSRFNGEHGELFGTPISGEIGTQ
jgi:branched-chain amino acid transport system substrate-binding protein